MVARRQKANPGYGRMGNGNSGESNIPYAVVALDQSTHVSDSRRGSKKLIRFVDAFAGAALALAIFASVTFFLPTSIWFEVRSVQVFNSSQGVSPRMLVDRTIHREFLADWIVSVYRVKPDGLESACRAQGHTNYEVDARLPPVMDLDWWTWPTQCNLGPGEYIARTIWTIDVLGLFHKEARVTSNPFRIYSPEEAPNDESTQAGPAGKIL